MSERIREPEQLLTELADYPDSQELVLRDENDRVLFTTVGEARQVARAMLAQDAERE